MTSDRVIKMSLTTTDKSSSRGYLHSVDQNTRSIATPGLKHFTLDTSIIKRVPFIIREFKKTTTTTATGTSLNKKV